MRNKLKTLIRLVLFFLIITIILHFVDLKSVLNSLRSISPKLILVLLLLEIAFILIDSYRFATLSKGAFSILISIKSRMASTVSSLILPGTATSEVIRFLILNKHKKGVKLKTAIILFSNRIAGLLGLLTLALISLAYSDRMISIEANKCFIYIPYITVVSILIFPALITHSKIRFILLGPYLKFSSIKFKALYRKAYISFYQISHIRVYYKIVLCNLLTAIIAALQFWSISKQFNVGGNFFDWCIITAIASISAIIPVGLGRVGGQDAALVLLSNVIQGDPSTMLSLSLLLHGISIITSLPGIYWLININVHKKLS